MYVQLTPGPIDFAREIGRAISTMLNLGVLHPVGDIYNNNLSHANGMALQKKEPDRTYKTNRPPRCSPCLFDSNTYSPFQSVDGVRRLVVGWFIGT